MSLNCTVTPRGYEKDVQSDLTLDSLCFFRWHSGTRMATRQPSGLPVGAGTGGGPACVPAVGVSTGPWTAGGAAGTQSRASGVLCRLPPAPAPSRLLASSPVKCKISVKSKHEPSHGEGRKDTGKRKGSLKLTGAHYHPCHTCSPASSLPFKHQLNSHGTTQGEVALVTLTDLILQTLQTFLHLRVFLYYLTSQLVSVQKICVLPNEKESKTQALA